MEYHQWNTLESEKDTGIVIDITITFDHHMSEKINKANSIMGVLRRPMDCTTFTLLYTVLVKPYYMPITFGTHI